MMGKDFLIITGSYPPDICGVGYGTSMLMQTPTAQNWMLYYRQDWRFKTLFCHISAIEATRAKYILMQYPTQGYGWSLVPHLLCIYFSWFTRKKFGVIVHEQSQQSLKGYLALILILISANKLIFTNKFERNFAIKRIPLVAHRSAVVKIFSQINAQNPVKVVAERSVDIVNFGLMFPSKGIEQFIKETSALTSKYKVVLAGKIPEGFEDYFTKIKALSEDAGIEIRLDLSDDEISALLNDSKIAYLPFPDGASERRGSMLASMLNGAVVVTTYGKYTTSELAESVVDIAGTSLEQILKNDGLLNQKQQLALRYMKTQLPQSVDEVAASYNQFMREEA